MSMRRLLQRAFAELYGFSLQPLTYNSTESSWLRHTDQTAIDDEAGVGLPNEYMEACF